MEALFTETDFLSLLFPALILLYVGQHFMNSSPTAEVWGKRIASFVFLTIVGMELLTSELIDPLEFCEMMISAILIAGMVLGLCLIFLPLPLILYQQTVGKGISRMKNWLRNRSEKLSEKNEKREREERQRRREEEWKLNAPERDRQKNAEEQREKNQIDQQHRREEVRLRCQLLYDQNALEIREKLPPDRLDVYFEQYLSDYHSAEMVEHRGELLKEMIKQSLDTESNGQPDFGSLPEIAIYFREQRAEIEKLDFDIIARQTIQASLCTQEEALIRAFLSRRH